MLLREVFLGLQTAVAEQFVFPRRLKRGRVFGPGAVDPFTPVPQTFRRFVLDNSGVEGQNRRCCSVLVTVAPFSITHVCLSGNTALHVSGLGIVTLGETPVLSL